MTKNRVHFVVLCGLMAGTLFGAEVPAQAQKKSLPERFRAEGGVWKRGIAAAKKKHIQNQELSAQEMQDYISVLKRVGGLTALLLAIGVTATAISGNQPRVGQVYAFGDKAARITSIKWDQNSKKYMADVYVTRAPAMGHPPLPKNVQVISSSWQQR